MQPRLRIVKEGHRDQKRKGKFLVSGGEEEQRRNLSFFVPLLINLGKGNIWSTEGVNILPKGKIVVGGAGGTTHI